jgi:hypothetical protein
VKYAHDSRNKNTGAKVKATSSSMDADIENESTPEGNKEKNEMTASKNSSAIVSSFQYRIMRTETLQQKRWGCAKRIELGDHGLNSTQTMPYRSQRV